MDCETQTVWIQLHSHIKLLLSYITYITKTDSYIKFYMKPKSKSKNINSMTVKVIYPSQMDS